MKIDHVALYTRNMEGLKAFYETYFGAVPGEVYVNSAKGFRSYFLSFSDGARLELMQQNSIPLSLNDPQTQFTGWIHVSFSVGSSEKVDLLAEQFRRNGIPIVDGPRRTGDGYYELAALDPDGNRIEVTA